ncbi:MAG: GumC family protein [Inquilinaceae bacterium]
MNIHRGMVTGIDGRGDDYNRLADRDYLNQTDQPTLSLDHMLRVVRRRIGLLVLSVVVVMAAAIITISRLEPLYTAETTVMVDPREQQVVNLDAVVGGRTSTAETMQSEVQILRSAGLAKRVIADTGLATVDEFNPPDDQEVSLVGGVIAGLRDLFLGGDEESGEELVLDPANPAVAFELEQSKVLRMFDQRLDVTAVGQSRVISIRFTSADPALARAVADSVANLYLTRQLEAKADAREVATNWLGERLTNLRSEVEETEAAVETFRTISGISEGQDAGLLSQQISELNTQLILARTEFETATARLRAVEEMVETRGSRSVFDVVDSRAVDGLREQEAVLRQRAAEASVEYGPRHPVMINLQAEIGALQAQMNQEAGNLLVSLRNEVAVLGERVVSLESAVRALRNDSLEINTAESQLRALEREAEASRAVYENYLNRFKETEQVGVEQTYAWVVSRAELPSNPSFPNKTLLLMVSFAGALSLGIGLMVAAELLERGFRTGQEIERALHIPTLGLVPKVQAGLLRRRSPQEFILKHPVSVFSEAIRSLYTSLLISQQRGSSGNVFLFTSAESGEGKSTTVASVGRVAAKAGQSVLVIDCDLRIPQMHKALKLTNDVGLSSIVLNDVPVEKAIQRDLPSGADVITAGPGLDSPLGALGILNSPKFDEVLLQLRPRYDLILIDSPPVMHVSDPRVLVRKVDQCALVVKWRFTRRTVVDNAIKQLQDAGANMFGVVLNQVETKSFKTYGEGDIGVYYVKRAA